MPLKFCCKNIVKIACTYHFLKKKKKWNGIVAMALPNSIPLFTIPNIFFYPLFGQWYYHKPIANFFSLLFRQCHCHNSIPLFFFKEMICAHNFYNIFTTIFKWQVVIVRLKKVILGSVWIELIVTETENWKHCNKIIFKCMNSVVGLVNSVWTVYE